MESNCYIKLNVVSINEYFKLQSIPQHQYTRKIISETNLDEDDILYKFPCWAYQKSLKVQTLAMADGQMQVMTAIREDQFRATVFKRIYIFTQPQPPLLRPDYVQCDNAACRFHCTSRITLCSMWLYMQCICFCINICDCVKHS